MPKTECLLFDYYGWRWYSTSIPNPSKWIAKPCCKQKHAPSIVMPWMAKQHVGNAMGCIQCHFGNHTVNQCNAKPGRQPTDMTTWCNAIRWPMELFSHQNNGSSPKPLMDQLLGLWVFPLMDHLGQAPGGNHLSGTWAGLHSVAHLGPITLGHQLVHGVLAVVGWHFIPGLQWMRCHCNPMETKLIYMRSSETSFIQDAGGQIGHWRRWPWIFGWVALWGSGHLCPTLAWLVSSLVDSGLLVPWWSKQLPMHNITKGPGQQVGNKENVMPKNGKCIMPQNGNTMVHEKNVWQQYWKLKYGNLNANG